jgi:hypothetical protein
MARHRAETQRGLRLRDYLHRDRHRLRLNKGLSVEDLRLIVALEHSDQKLHQFNEMLAFTEEALLQADAAILDAMAEDG